jgi:tripartite-type tricarboxylate transporter receptor subunit TctC
MGVAILHAIVAVLLMCSGAMAADSDADFYKSKQIRLLVSTDAGTVYDTYARLIAQYLPTYIPGHPSILVENMPGASGLRVANYMASIAPRDGTVIAAVHSSVPTADLFTPDTGKFTSTKLSWIGSASREPFVGIIWNSVPVTTLEDLRTREITVGGASLGSASVDMAIIMKDVFGLKLKLVTGYKSSLEVKFAMEKREIDGTLGNAWGSVKTEAPEWLRDHKIRVLTQFGLTKHPELPDVPLFIDIAKTAPDRQMLELLLARQEFAKPYFAPPDIPPQRLQVLRLAFDETMHDQAFLADAKARLLEINAMSGADLAAKVEQLENTPRSIIDRINAVFANYKG